VTDFPDWQAPQAHATAISTTGAPPLVFKQVIDALIGTNIGASGSVTRPGSGQFSLNQPGYEIALNVATLGATAPIVSVELQWYDSAFGQLIDDETYFFYSGNLNGHFIHGRGPTKGDRVVVVITNHSGASGITVSYTLLQTSRVFTREFWRTITKNGVNPVFPGFTAISHNVSGNYLGFTNSSVPAGQTVAFLLPLYTGTARLFGQGAAAAGQTTWIMLPSADPVAGAVNSFQGVNGQSGFAPFGASSLYVEDIALPRSQAQLQIINSLTTAQPVITSLIAQEDRA
jgi:hypothetical protein